MAEDGEVEVDLDAIFASYAHEETGTMDQRDAWTAICMTGRNPTSNDIKEFWQEHELADEDHIDKEKFMALVDRVAKPNMEEMIEALRKFDKNESGCIDKEELISILKSADDLYGDPIDESDESFQNILDRGDTNNDGKLDIQELAKLIMSGEAVL